MYISMLKALSSLVILKKSLINFIYPKTIHIYLIIECLLSNITEQISNNGCQKFYTNTIEHLCT